MDYNRVNWKDHPSNETLLTAENLNVMDEGIENASEEINKLNEKISEIADIVYPVGAIYLSVSNVNPGSLFGGTWIQFAIGRTLFGLDPDDDTFNAAEQTGGSKEKKISEANLPQHTHGYTPQGIVGSKKISATVDYQDEGHKHAYDLSHCEMKKRVLDPNAIEKASFLEVWTGESKKQREMTSGETTGHKHNINIEYHDHSFQGKTERTESAGSSEGLNILPPYITCYMWKRVK